MLGGGFVAGSVNLMAGQPGIGKSTLLLQVAYGIAKNAKVIYEVNNGHQAGPAGNNTGINNQNLRIATSTSANDIAAATIAEANVQVVIVDYPNH